MTNKPTASRQTPPAGHRVIPEEAYASVCSVRDELRLFAAVTARQAKRNAEMLICRNTLAHCFDHLAQRLDSAIDLLASHPSE